MDDLPGLLSGMRLFVEANRRFIGLPLEQLVEWTVGQLVKVNAAKVVGQELVNEE